MNSETITQKIESVVEAAKTPSFLARILGAVSYLGILSLIPIVLRTKNDYTRFHARQGLLLFISEIIFTLIWVIPFIGWVIGFLGWVFCFIFSVIGLVRALRGQRWRIPVLHRFVDKVKF